MLRRSLTVSFRSKSAGHCIAKREVGIVATPMRMQHLFLTSYGLATNETTKDDAARVLEMLRNRLEEVVPQVVAFCWKVEIGHIPTCWNLLKSKVFGNWTPTPMKFSKSGLKRFPVKLKDFVATGILEGLKVRNIKGQKVVTPTVFELHAGPISESSNGVSKLVCKSCMEMSEAQTSSQLQTAATCSKSIPPVVQPRSPETVVVPESLNTEMAVPNSLNSEMAVPESSNTQMIPKALSTRMKQSASRGKSRGKITRKHPQIRGRFELFLKQNQHSKKPVKDILQV
ncbi:hypothetical protein P8452_64709 [Trifolium repens]|nr:hypothetical protein P8452_64709 [Trifolium repens]